MTRQKHKKVSLRFGAIHRIVTASVMRHSFGGDLRLDSGFGTNGQKKKTKKKKEEHQMKISSIVLSSMVRGANQSDAANVVFYLNFNNETCVCFFFL